MLAARRLLSAPLLLSCVFAVQPVSANRIAATIQQLIPAFSYFFFSLSRFILQEAYLWHIYHFAFLFRLPIIAQYRPFLSIRTWAVMSIFKMRYSGAERAASKSLFWPKVAPLRCNFRGSVGGNRKIQNAKIAAKMRSRTRALRSKCCSS